ncbi:hypothetical protein NE865_14957 [Phthorimaea operculella]|nr:hypothetical protein NE865_14957 [Phthorimaea operculella]
MSVESQIFLILFKSTAINGVRPCKRPPLSRLSKHLYYRMKTQSSPEMSQEILKLKQCGALINWKKSVLTPSRVVEYLGIVWDPSQNAKLLNVDKKERISREIQAIIAKGKWSWRQAKSLLGRLVFAAFVVPLGLLHCRTLQRASSRLPENLPSLYCPIPQPVLRDLTWWLKNLNNHSPIVVDGPKSYIVSDASGSGWGVTVNEKKLSGVWNMLQAEWLSNVKEMFAVVQGVRACRRYNVEIDRLSRAKKVPEWRLSPHILHKIFQKWGNACIDLFASARSAVIPNYVSLDATDPNAVFVNAFSQQWSYSKAYLFPPPALIPQVLQHLNSARGTYIMIVPRWNKVFWRADLKRRALAPPFTIENLKQNLIDLSTGLPPTEIQRLHLEAWKIRGGPGN